MKQKRNYTLTEQEENKIVNQIYNKKILLIKKLLETCLDRRTSQWAVGSFD